MLQIPFPRKEDGVFREAEEKRNDREVHSKTPVNKLDLKGKNVRGEISVFCVFYVFCQIISLTIEQ